MTDEDAERIRLRRDERADRMACGLCGGRPTCPMLHDELWKELWSRAESVGLVEPPCGCVKYVVTLAGSTPVETAHYDDPGCPRNRRRRELLCLECAERCCGRRLTLDDLLPCAGNYAHYVMQKRATSQELRYAVLELKVAARSADTINALNAVLDLLPKS